MQADVLFKVFRAVSYVVIALTIASIAYAGITGVRYWSGIGV